MQIMMFGKSREVLTVDYLAGYCIVDIDGKELAMSTKELEKRIVRKS